MPFFERLAGLPRAVARDPALLGQVHLVYELLVMNVSSSVMTLDRLETLDASKGDAVVNTKSGDEIVRALQGADLEATIRAFPPGAPRRSSLSS